MRMPGARCVVTELDEGPDLRESRRMQIAAEQGGSLGIILIAGQSTQLGSADPLAMRSRQQR